MVAGNNGTPIEFVVRFVRPKESDKAGTLTTWITEPRILQNLHVQLRRRSL